MKLLITGSGGFMGRNLTEQLKQIDDHSLFLCDVETTRDELREFLGQCDSIIHLAGVNRPDQEEEFLKVNRDFTAEMTGLLRKIGRACPIIAASSIQAETQTPYGRSKRCMEETLNAYGQATGAQIIIYRLPNVFGKWCRPDYNSVVATFCHRIAREEAICIHDGARMLRLVYIDDVVEELIRALHGHGNQDDSGFGFIPVETQVSLKEVAEKLHRFHDVRNTITLPSLLQEFDQKLYSTYLSYLPEDRLNYPLILNEDDRGFFSEVLKSDFFGQISVSRTKPGVVRGNHWHHRKIEKFLIVEGRARICLRTIGSAELVQYQVSGEKPEIIEIPPGFTHSLENIGSNDMVALIWCSESFDPMRADTYYEEV